MIENPEDGNLEPDTTYGSSRQGLIWGFVFRPGHPARNVGPHLLSEGIESALDADPEAFLWLHFALSNAATTRWLRAHLSLPDAFFASLEEEVGSTRLEKEGESLVAVVHDVMFNFTLDPSDVSTVVLCLGPRWLVSVRLKPLRSIDRLRAEVKGGETFRSPVELLSRLLRDQAELLVDIVRKHTGRVNLIEDKLLSNRISTNRRELSSMRRSLVRLQRLLAPEPAALFRLLNRPPGWISAEDIQDLRQAAEEFSAAVGDSASLAERLKLLQEEYAAQVSEQTGRTLFTLTMVTVLALPINLVTGLFGMNVGGIPLSGELHGFMIIVGSLTAMTGLLGTLVFGRRRD